MIIVGSNGRLVVHTGHTAAGANPIIFPHPPIFMCMWTSTAQAAVYPESAGGLHQLATQLGLSVIASISNQTMAYMSDSTLV